MPTTTSQVLLADRIWIAVAMLHREFPDREDFGKDEIRRKLDELDLAAGTERGSVNAHLKEHLIANVPPSSSKYRMLVETRPGFLRLFRPGDWTHPARVQLRRPSKQIPKREELPPQYHPLLNWYEQWIQQRGPKSQSPNWEDDPLIRLIGSGREIWADEHADEYVNRLREDPT